MKLVHQLVTKVTWTSRDFCSSHFLDVKMVYHRASYRKFVVVITIFQVAVAVLFCTFVRYDKSIDPRFHTENQTISDNYMNDYSSKFSNLWVSTSVWPFVCSDFGYSSHVICGLRIFDDISEEIWILGRLFYDAFDRILRGICHFGQRIYVRFWSLFLILLIISL